MGPGTWIDGGIETGVADVDGELRGRRISSDRSNVKRIWSGWRSQKMGSAIAEDGISDFTQYEF